MLRSWGLVLSRQFSERTLGFLHIFPGEFAGFNEVGHDRLDAVAKQAQKFVDQPALRGLAGDQRFENVRVADFLNTTEGFLGFQSIDRGLHGCVSGSVFGGKGFLNLSDGRDPVAPESLHDLQLKA
jgi:hypothetical protein